MTDKIDDIVIPILRQMQGDISVLKESVKLIDARIGSMKSYTARSHTNLNWHNEALDEHRGRLEALEKEDD